ncbi:1766_t:CDS:1, partial [Cetraspora pellucida]
FIRNEQTKLEQQLVLMVVQFFTLVEPILEILVNLILNTYGSIPTPGLIANEEIKFVQCVILGHEIYIYGGYGVYQMNILDSLQLYWSRFSSALTYSKA